MVRKGGAGDSVMAGNTEDEDDVLPILIDANLVMPEEGEDEGIDTFINDESDEDGASIDDDTKEDEMNTDDDSETNSLM
ncbi:hypothetical protein AAC387_Pa01g2548 [Persea americana]